MKSEKVGDRLQAIVPLVGAACAWQIRDLGEYAIRYALTLSSVHAVKNATNTATMNMRPNGDIRGMPSGHTMSAAYGASYIARTCSQKIPYLGTVAVLGAAFTGVSRVEAGKHYGWQVLLGAIFGILGDVAFRRQTRKWKRARRYKINTQNKN